MNLENIMQSEGSQELKEGRNEELLMDIGFLL